MNSKVNGKVNRKAGGGQTPLQKLVTAARTGLGLTLDEVAARMGAGPAHLSRVCAGQRTSRRFLAALAEALGAAEPAVVRAYRRTTGQAAAEIRGAAPATPLRDLVDAFLRAEGLSQDAFAARLGLRARDWVFKVCAGQKAATPELLAGIARVTGRPPAEVEDAYRRTVRVPELTRHAHVVFTEEEYAAVARAAAGAGLKVSEWLRRQGARAAARAAG